jgi:hypothetical protein
MEFADCLKLCEEKYGTAAVDVAFQIHWLPNRSAQYIAGKGTQALLPHSDSPYDVYKDGNNRPFVSNGLESYYVDDLLDAAKAASPPPVEQRSVPLPGQRQQPLPPSGMAKQYVAPPPQIPMTQVVPPPLVQMQAFRSTVTDGSCYAVSCTMQGISCFCNAVNGAPLPWMASAKV